MASICIASNNGPFLLSQERLSFSVKNSTSSLGGCGFTSPSCSSVCFSGYSNSQKYHKRLLMDLNGKNRQNHLRRGDISRFSLRLKRRLGILSVKLRRTSSVVVIVSMLDGIGPFIRKNMRKVIIPASVSLALGLTFLFIKLTAIPSPKAVPYSDLVSNLQNGIVSKVLFEEGTRRIYFNSDSCNAETSQTEVDTELVKPPPTTRRASKWQYSTRKIDHDESYLLSLMREKGTMYSSAPQSLLMSLRSVLMTVMYLWIPLTPLMWLLYRQLSSANSPAKKRRPTTHTVSFDDVEGVDAAKVELMEIVSCLQGDINYNKLGAKLPKGVLLVGPPGTGKTLLARAVAGESGVPFFSVSASEFVELFVGRGAARIRDLFNVARKNSPSIIFIDELDAVGGKRGRSFNDERDQTLNQLLTEMDGFNSDMKVVVIAATNRPEALDAALCRPGRFSRKVFVCEPDEDGRRKILGVHLRGVPLEEDSSLICSLVASLTQGFAGADLANIVNEAALLAARQGAECVRREDIMEAIERAKYGVNGKEARQSTLSREVGKLFPWMPLLNGWGNSRQDGFEGPIGYQTLS